MIKVQTCFVILVLSLLLSYVSPQTLAPFLNYTEYYPGSTYDIGLLESTDIIKVNLDWVLFADYGLPITIKLFVIVNHTAI